MGEAGDAAKPERSKGSGFAAEMVAPALPDEGKIAALGGITVDSRGLPYPQALRGTTREGGHETAWRAAADHRDGQEPA
ncbi:MAG TPA: hypothetical protein VIL09_15625 [Microvirga sp.]|jgi:hypothetical protein